MPWGHCRECDWPVWTPKGEYGYCLRERIEAIRSGRSAPKYDLMIIPEGGCDKWQPAKQQQEVVQQ